MAPALAEGILALDFPEDDAARIEELNVRADEGQLTDDEQAKLEAYVNASDLLAYWQSKARQAVQISAHDRVCQGNPAARRRPMRVLSCAAIGVPTPIPHRACSSQASWTRRDNWEVHFSPAIASVTLLGVVIHGLTPVGRATVGVLGLNDEMRQLNLLSPVRNDRSSAGFVVKPLAGTRYALYSSF
jgi:hypothetical protein